MHRFIAVVAHGHAFRSRRRSGSFPRGTPILLLCGLLLTATAPAGVINGKFQSGDLTGWDSNLLIPPLSIPASTDVTTVKGNLAGEVHFATTVAGHYAGSLSQDFYTGNATRLTFDIGFAASSRVAPGEPDVVDTLDVLVLNLDTNTTIVHTLHFENQPGEATGVGLDGHVNGLGIHAFANLPAPDMHVRLALVLDFHTLAGVSSSGQLLVDNVALVPEPSSTALAICAALLPGCAAIRRRKSCRTGAATGEDATT